MLWWIIGGLFVLSAIGGVGNKIVQAQEKASAEAARQQKLGAYADYLRRTSADPAVAAMSEREIMVHLDRVSKELQSAETAYTAKCAALLVVAVIVVVAGFIQSAGNGVTLLVLAGLGLFGLDKRLRATRDREQARIAQMRGVDAARLLDR